MTTPAPAATGRNDPTSAAHAFDPDTFARRVLARFADTDLRTAVERVLGDGVVAESRALLRCASEDGTIDAPTVVTGHQAGIWHPGILAKYRALDALATAIDAERPRDDGPTHRVEILVEHDAHDPGVIALPDLEGDRLVRRTWRALPCDAALPTGVQAPATPAPPPTLDLRIPSSIRSGTAAIERALRTSFEQEPSSLAWQLLEANRALRPGDIRRPLPEVVPTGALLRLPAGRALLDRILADPNACARGWNSAVDRTSRVARPLAIDEADPARTEVPVWGLDASGRRERLIADALAERVASDAPLFPTAFLHTALWRLALADGFIHGIGGGVYEIATERWISAWLGIPLAPYAVVSADVRLPLDVFLDAAADDLPTAVDLHRLRHDPDAVDAPTGGPSDRKAAWLERLDALPPDSRARAETFRAMHADLAERRDERVVELTALARRVAGAREHARARTIANARDWAFPLFDSGG